jgi:hypothetical protein
MINERHHGLYSHLRRSSIVTFLRESYAVARRSILLISYLPTSGPSSTYLGTTAGPSFSEAIIASFHLSTHKHHLHPSFNPWNPGRGVIKSFPASQQLSYLGLSSVKLTFLLAVLQEFVRNYGSDKVFSGILVRAPAVPISEETSGVR